MKKVISFVLACAMVFGLVSVWNVPQAQAITLEDANVSTFEDETYADLSGAAYSHNVAFTAGPDYGTFKATSSDDPFFALKVKNPTTIAECPYVAIRFKCPSGATSAQDWLYPVTDKDGPGGIHVAPNTLRNMFDGQWHTVTVNLKTDLQGVMGRAPADGEKFLEMWFAPPAGGEDMQIAWFGVFSSEEDVHTYETLFENRGKGTPKDYEMLPNNADGAINNAWVVAPGEYVGVRFKTKAAFTAVKMDQWSPKLPGEDLKINWELSVYTWNQDYNTSVGGTAVATASGTSTDNGMDYEIPLDKSVPAGQYVLVFKVISKTLDWDSMHIKTVPMQPDRANLFQTFTNTQKYHSDPENRFPYLRLVADSSVGDELFEPLTDDTPADAYHDISDPTVGYKNSYWDALWIDSTLVADSLPLAPSTYVANGIDNTAGTIRKLRIKSWVGFDQEIVAAGYSIDDGPMVEDPHAFDEAPDNGIIGAAGANAKRVYVDIPVGNLTGDHTIRVVLKLKDGKLVRFNNADPTKDITIQFKGPAEGNLRPSLVITKIAVDTKRGDNGSDVYEAFEIVNTSGTTLNLYDYVVFYNGVATSKPKYGTIVELTPFKPGDFRDESTWTVDGMPKNPDTFEIAPGEVVVVWAYGDAAVKEGLTSIADFRTFWNIPESTRVVCWDGNSSVADGGSDGNFALKNKDTGTYGIIKNSVTLATRVAAGEAKFEEGESYVTLAFGTDPLPSKSAANKIAVCGYDGAQGLSLVAYEESGDALQLGALTDAQKEELEALLPAVTEPEHVCKDHLTKVDAKAATCTEDGNKEYYKCECGKLYADANAETQVTAESVVEKAKGHSYGKDGVCTVCGEKDPNTKTGDSFNACGWVVLLTASSCVLAAMPVLRRRKNEA